MISNLHVLIRNPYDSTQYKNITCKMKEKDEEGGTSWGKGRNNKGKREDENEGSRRWKEEGKRAGKRWRKGEGRGSQEVREKWRKRTGVKSVMLSAPQ